MILIGMMTLSGLTSCSWLSVKMTPFEVIDAVARGDAVAQEAVLNVAELKANPMFLEMYLKINADAWRELTIWFELRKPDGN